MVDTETIMKALSRKIPQDKMMLVPMFLLMIDPKTWKFPEGFRTPEFQEIVDVIENCDELKDAFRKQHDEVT